MYNRWVGYNEGGNETHIKELAVYLNKSGHTIDMLTTGKNALLPIKKHIHKIYNISSPKEYFSYSYLRFFYSFRYIFDSFVVLSKILSKNKYDIVTVHFSLEAFVMRFMRPIFHVPYTLILVGDTDLELIEGKRADSVSQLTKYMAKECIPYGYYPKVLTKGIDQDRFHPKIDGSKIRQKYAGKDQFLILCVCRLDPRKNLETLLRSALHLKKKHGEKFKFVIVGGGVEETKLKKLIKKLKLQKTVSMVGSIPSTSDLLPQYYAACDVFALPTLYEGFGYVFSEAMSFSKPVIGTNTSAVPEVIKNVGIIVPIRSPHKLAKAIERVCTRPRLYKKLSVQSIQKVNIWYWKNLIKKYVLLLRNGIRNYQTSKNGILAEIINLLIDIPKIIFIGIRPLLKANNKWGSVLNKKNTY